MKYSITKKLDAILQRRWLSHIIFWLSVFILQSLISEAPYEDFYKTFIHVGVMLLPQILASYWLVYFMIPKLIYKKKYLFFVLIFALSIYLFSVLARVLVVYLIEEINSNSTFKQEGFWEILQDWKMLANPYFFRVFLMALVMLIIKLLKENFEEKNLRELSERKKVTAELNFFKAQIHPHFMFNTLNNLYLLTLKKSDKAPDTVLKLSEMLDYMLYQCNDPFVSIEKESKLIHNYIDLEKLRYGNRLSLTIVEKIDDPKTLVAPLILISLIENAFKHGASASLENPIINIEMNVQNNILLFSIYNTRNKVEQSNDSSYKKGIGLSNTKSQLQLIYPNKHHLKIDIKDYSYTVNLKIDLNK